MARRSVGSPKSHVELTSVGSGKSEARLGEVLRQLRRERTQAEVAAEAGISRSYLASLETNRHGSRLPRHTVMALATALEVEPGLLLSLAGLPVTPADLDDVRPDFVSFVLSEPTLPNEPARSAVLAVYFTVMELKTLKDPESARAIVQVRNEFMHGRWKAERAALDDLFRTANEITDVEVVDEESAPAKPRAK